jgi:pantoate--beta-alanine ligase
MTERRGDPAEARAWCRRARARGAALGFVPTMGALHDGHLALVRRAKRENELAVVSVFVNPLQFNDPRDYELYPRDLEGDAGKLAAAGCDLVFTGTPEQFFPEAAGDVSRTPRVDPGPAALDLEGLRRPGHFAGVATIVERLFEIVRPARAYFGEKDFQQTLVVAHLARRLGFPQIVVCPTVREPSGLAMSSRNLRLSARGRQQALALSRALFAAREEWRRGRRGAPYLRRTMMDVLERAEGVQLEYADLRDPEAWSAGPPPGRVTRAQALVAAWVEGVRLIDTLRLDREIGP